MAEERQSSGRPKQRSQMRRQNSKWSIVQRPGYEERSLPNAWWCQRRSKDSRRAGARTEGKLEARSLFKSRTRLVSSTPAREPSFAKMDSECGSHSAVVRLGEMFG